VNRRDDAWRSAKFEELAATGSQDVRNELVESFAPLAEFFAKRYKDRGVESQDLRQVAQLALVKAVDRFDADFGVQFSTFAGRTIDGELKKYFRDKSWSVRVPRSLQERSALIRQMRDALSAENGRAPTIEQISEASGLSVDEVIEGLDAQSAYRSSSLDVGSSDSEEGMSIAATLGANDPGFHQTELEMAVKDMLAGLPERDRTIIELRFFENLSQHEIADRVGISQMHVSRLLRRSFDELRTKLRQ
jgi:RNA polymerase sigma-B factor